MLVDKIKKLDKHEQKAVLTRLRGKVQASIIDDKYNRKIADGFVLLADRIQKIKKDIVDNDKILSKRVNTKIDKHDFEIERDNLVQLVESKWGEVLQDINRIEGDLNESRQKFGERIVGINLDDRQQDNRIEGLESRLDELQESFIEYGNHKHNYYANNERVEGLARALVEIGSALQRLEATISSQRTLVEIEAGDGIEVIKIDTAQGVKYIIKNTRKGNQVAVLNGSSGGGGGGALQETAIKGVTNEFTSTNRFGVSGNFVQITWDGEFTLEGQSTRYDDIVFEMTPARRGALTKPDWDDVNLGLLFPRNDTSEYVDIVVQFPHRWKEGSIIYPHVHCVQGSTLQAVFKMDYKWYSLGATIPLGATTYVMDQYALTYDGGATISNIIHNSGITGGDRTISSIMKLRLYRDDNVYPGDMLVDQFDIHIEVDSFGSKDEYIK